jgi:hypothetical protein
VNPSLSFFSISIEIIIPVRKKLCKLLEEHSLVTESLTL